jgi:mRNA interferase HigB
MHVIAKKALVQFWNSHPDAKEPLKAWYSICEKSNFDNLAALKQAFRLADKVGKFVVFNIGGHKFRLIAIVHFKYHKVYIRAVLSHKEYDKDHWKEK